MTFERCIWYSIVYGQASNFEFLEIGDTEATG